MRSCFISTSRFDFVASSILESGLLTGVAASSPVKMSERKPREGLVPCRRRRSARCKGTDDNSPSNSRLGVLDAPSPSSSAGLVSGGVCTRDPLAFLVLIGADIEGRREFVRLSGRPSSSLFSGFAPGWMESGNEIWL